MECHGNIAAAARTLKMDRGQLSRLLKKHRVDKTVFRSAEASG
jgi:ActR/RegA family two-component response regulator